MLMTLLILCLPAWFLFAFKGWKKGLLRLTCAIILILAISLYLNATYYIILDTIPLLVLFISSYLSLQASQLDRQTYKLLKQKLSLNNKEILLEELIENANQGILILDNNYNINRLNEMAKNLLAIPNASIIGNPVQIFFPNTDIIRSSVNSNERVETQILDSHCNKVDVEISANRIELQDTKLFVIFLHDISYRLKEKEKLIYEATHDQLTGLFNRSQLLTELDLVVSLHSGQQRGATLFLIDLNNFKDINDTLGHDTGDQLLVGLGSRFKSLSSESTHVARLGGDEFCILIRSTMNQAEIKSYCNTIQKLISEPIYLRDMALTLDSAIGIALIPQHATTSNDALKAADVAMYKSKKQGSAFSVYETISSQSALRSLTISNDLKHAINNDQFELYYQPQVDLKTNNVICCEALVRWEHPSLGMIFPDEFIPLIENSPLVKPMTMFVIEQAALFITDINKNYPEMKIAINISAKLLEDQSLPDDITSLINKYKISPEKFILEITESIAMKSHERALIILNRLRQQGFTLSIDDFGTSYSSFSYLKQLPTKELKIDKLFITNICNNEDDRIITESIIALAHGLNLRVVAEGIEDSQTFSHLREAGCDIAQGYWLSKPLPQSNILQWITDWYAQTHSSSAVSIANQ